MKKLFVIAFIFLYSPFIFAACFEDSIKKVSSDGDYIFTMSGRVFEVFAGDNIDAMLWLPVSDLTICGPKFITSKGKQYSFYTILNSDEGEKVDAFKVK